MNLLLISYQDIRAYSVSWVVFPVLAVLFSVSGYRQIGIPELLINTFINLLIILIQLMLLSVYFSLRDRRLIFMLDSKIGLGDILFFIAISLAFSPLNFILFLSISLSIILLVVLISKSRNSKDDKIPLAGYLAICYLIFIPIKIWLGIDAYGAQLLNLLNN